MWPSFVQIWLRWIVTWGREVLEAALVLWRSILLGPLIIDQILPRIPPTLTRLDVLRQGFCISPPSPSPAPLFVSLGRSHRDPISIITSSLTFKTSRSSPTWVGRYRYTGAWFCCRVRSRDVDGTYTVVWEDGTLQIGTTLHELRRPVGELSRQIELSLAALEPLPSSSSSSSTALSEPISASGQGATASSGPRYDPPTFNGMTVWEAAKRGDVTATLALMDRGDATPNDVERLATNTGSAEAAGRTPLYWAAFGGHAELVRELLARGGLDPDGTVYLAVTSRERADDQRDLLFDPDTGIYSDGVDYPIQMEASPPSSSSSSSSEASNRSSVTLALDQDNTALIRAMLLAAQAASQQQHAGLTTRRRARRLRQLEQVRQFLPHRLYSSAEAMLECAVCFQNPARAIAVPCGHISCCIACLTQIRKNRDGCPICRAPIKTIVPHQEDSSSTPKYQDTTTLSRTNLVE